MPCHAKRAGQDKSRSFSPCIPGIPPSIDREQVIAHLPLAGWGFSPVLSCWQINGAVALKWRNDLKFNPIIIILNSN